MKLTRVLGKDEPLVLKLIHKQEIVCNLSQKYKEFETPGTTCVLVVYMLSTRCYGDLVGDLKY